MSFTGLLRCGLLLGICLLAVEPARGQVAAAPEVARPVIPEPDRVVPYRKTLDGAAGALELTLELFLPEGHRETDKRAAVVLFFGGGWSGGSTQQMRPFARYLADRGMLAACADYRVKSRQDTEPFACVEDAKAAVRYLRGHASELGIDPHRIGAGGGSAGGHLAACTGIIEKFEGQAIGVASKVSSRPDVLILFNPVLDTSDQGYGKKKLGKRWRELSVNHHLRERLPATIVFHGTGDRTVPFANAEEFQKGMREAGNACELVSFEARGHGFFNAPAFRPALDGKDYLACLEAMDDFLVKSGFLVAH